MAQGTISMSVRLMIAGVATGLVLLASAFSLAADTSGALPTLSAVAIVTS
jgi:hypothetical protein